MDQVLDGGVAASPAPARIVQAGAAVLRGVAADVPPEMFGGAELRAMVATMLATMRAAPGVGLAAPQIGIPYKVCVLWCVVRCAVCCMLCAVCCTSGGHLFPPPPTTHTRTHPRPPPGARSSCSRTAPST